MYLRWAERHKYPAEVYDVSYGEAGIKSTTFAVKAPYAYGTLRGEQGTHRMVRISKYDNQGRRQTSFAGVDVVPVVEQTDHVDIPDDDSRVDVFRSSGPGGQGVNTTDSAVRITHKPTGIVVSCQNERSQIQNKASAMAVLQAKLLERRREEEAQELNALRGDGGRAWGSQIRNYVLYPYQMVKDQRRATRPRRRSRYSTARSTTSSRRRSAGCAARRRNPTSRGAGQVKLKNKRIPNGIVRCLVTHRLLLAGERRAPAPPARQKMRRGGVGRLRSG